MSDRPAPSTQPRSWTAVVRQWLERTIPARHLLPDRQPAYVSSWVYVLGVIALGSLFWVLLSGFVLAFFGPQWWHVSPQGRFFNSLHFWSVQVFFVAMVLHLWAQFFAAGWRDGRQLNWVVGVAVFALCIAVAFTGYVSQQNFDAQWIAVNAKDAMNSAGVGAFFNVLNFGQMYGMHILLLPLAVVVLVGVHVLMVRVRGVVKPVAKVDEQEGRDDE